MNMPGTGTMIGQAFFKRDGLSLGLATEGGA